MRASGKRVRRVTCDRNILRNGAPESVSRSLIGATFEKPKRWGKWLICATDRPALIFHFGMTGRFVWSGDDPEPHPHDRMTLEFSDGELRYRDQRKFGGVWLAGAHEVGDILGPLGPDALEVTEDEFIARLERRRGSIKAALMNQKVLAGLGNLTVDESLWQARIPPRKKASSLSKRELSAIYRACQKVLRDSSKEGLVPAKRTWLTGARNRSDRRCPRCHSGLERATVSGRTTFWCSRCQ
jgi:formamidopyrimidine-DNA glycosylase